MAISGNKLICAGGKAAPAWGDPGIWYDEVVTRAAGVMLLGDFNITDVATNMQFGFDTNQSSHLAANAFYYATSLITFDSAANMPRLYSPVNATEYRLCVVLAAAGAHYFIRVAGAWHYLGQWGSNATASLYAGIANRTAAWSADNIVVPSSVNWLPAPTLSDGFATAFGTSDGLGHAEGVAGSVGKGGGSKTWVEEGAWGISSGEAINTPPGGGELLTDGDMEDDPATNWTAAGDAVLTNTAEERTGGAGAQSLDVAKGVGGSNSPRAEQTDTVVNGKWTLATLWRRNVDATRAYFAIRDGILIEAVGANNATTDWVFDALSQANIDTSKITRLRVEAAGADGTSCLFDDVSTQQLDMNDCIATYDTSLSDVLLSAELTLPYDTHAGLILNLDDAATPANYTLVTQSGPTGDDIEVWKCVAGVLSRVSTTAGTYSAGKALRVRKSGSEVWVYYNDAYITKATISDAGIVDNTIHGIFSTYVSNTIDDFTIYGEGATGEWATLNNYDG